MASALKLPLLVLLTLLVCVPSVQVIGLWLGWRLEIRDTALLLMGTCAAWALLLASLAPVAIFFGLQSAYHFLKVFNLGAVGLTALAGTVMLCRVLRVASIQGLLPGTALPVFLVWTLLALFVGCQMAWTLRPFLGEPSLPFAWLRRGDREMNFYTAALISIRRLLG